MAPSCEELSKIAEKPQRFDALTSAPPWWYRRAASPAGAHPDKPAKPAMRPSGTLHTLPLEHLPGTRKHAGVRPVRQVLGRAIGFIVTFALCLDGAALMAASGTTWGTHPDPFTESEKEELGEFSQLRPVRKGETLREVAEAFLPGSSDPKSDGHWLLRLLVELNRHTRNAELQSVTREPERQKVSPMAQGMGSRRKQQGAKKAAKQAKVAAERAEGEGGAAASAPYADPRLRGVDFDNFIPAIDGDADERGLTGAERDGAVRVPVSPTHGREQPRSIWGKCKDQGKEMLMRCCLCIIHCGMRTAESCVTHMLTTITSRYLKGKGSDRGVIHKHLNERVWADLRVRRLVSLNQKGELNKVSFNGTEVRIMVADLLRGQHSLLLKAIEMTYAKLDVAESTSRLAEWRVVMHHWARAMHAGYKLRARKGDRLAFREHSLLYATLKSAIRPGITNWYDWQVFSAMPDMFDKYGSLMLLSQEGMEASQKRLNMVMRLNNNFSNAGRIPYVVKRAGLAQVQAYLKDRKRKKAKPAEWLYWRCICSFFAAFSDAFAWAKACKTEGREVSEAELTSMWGSFRGLGALRARWVGRWRLHENGQLEMGDTVNVTIDRVVRDPDRAADVHEIKPHTLRCAYTLNIRVTTKRGAAMAKEIASYYAVGAPRTLAADVSDRVRRVEIERARRKAWKKGKADRAKAGHWWDLRAHHVQPHYEFTPPPEADEDEDDAAGAAAAPRQEPARPPPRQEPRDADDETMSDVERMSDVEMDEPQAPAMSMRFRRPALMRTVLRLFSNGNQSEDWSVNIPELQQETVEGEENCDWAGNREEFEQVLRMCVAVTTPRIIIGGTTGLGGIVWTGQWCSYVGLSKAQYEELRPESMAQEDVDGM